MTERRSEDAGQLAPPRGLGQEPRASARTLEQPVVGDTAPRTTDRAPAGMPPGAPVQPQPAPPQAAPARLRPGPPQVTQSRPDSTITEPPEGTEASAGPPAPAKPRPLPERPTQAPAPAAAPSRTRPSGSRRATLRLARIDPWSVMKTALLLSLAFGIVVFVAVAVVWSVLDAANVWDAVNRSIADVVGGQSGANFDVQNYIGVQRVLGFTALVAVADVILLTAIATLSAFLYNLAASLLGGLEVTLAED